MSKARKKWVASVGAVAAFATLATGGALTANAADYTPVTPNSSIGLPKFYGSDDPMRTKENAVKYNPTQSYLAKTFEQDQKDGAGTDTNHDFWIDKILARTGGGPYGQGTNEAGAYNYEGADYNSSLFTRGRAMFMRDHRPAELGFMGNASYWDETGKDALRITVNVDGADQSMTEDASQRKQTPSYFKTVFTNGDGSIKVTEVKYITYNNVMVVNLTVESTTDRDVTIYANSPFAGDGKDGAKELTGRTSVTNNLTTIYPRFSGNDTAGNDFTVNQGWLKDTISLKANTPVTAKVQLGMIANELPDSTKEYEARYNGDLKDPAASYKDSVTAYNKWWVDNSPYVDTPEDNIDKTVVYRWWLSRFNMLDANMPGNTFQYPTSIEGVLGYNNQIVLTSGMFINDTKWFRNPEYSYGTWLSAGDTAKKGQSGYYYYHDNPGDPANWNHSYTQYITRAGWDSYKVHGGPSTVAEKLADQGAEDVQGLLASKTEPDDNDDQNANDNKLIDWQWNSMTGNDADAVSFAERRGRMDRADGSANLWANANAAAKAYKAAGDTANAEKMQKIADDIQSEVLSQLWNPDTKLIQHKFIDNGAFAKYKEINNYYPYSEGLMPTGNADYNSALRLFQDANEFPVFPFFTANQADKVASGNGGSNNFSIINATPLLQVYSSGIRNYDAAKNGYITNDQFKQLLYWVAFSHYQGGDNNYPDQNEFWNEDNNPGGTDRPSKNQDAQKNGGKITYRSWIHHTQLGTTNWTMVEDVAGMVPREDNKIELNPIAIPGWDYFTVNNLSYHGQDVSIVWDKDGSHYGGQAGYSLYVGGKLAFTSDKLTHLIYDPATGTVEDAGNSGAKVTVAADATKDVKSANQVTYGSGQRVTELLATAGVNADKESKSSVNLVLDGNTDGTTYDSDNGHNRGNAVDGKTVMESFWGTKGSKNAADTLAVTFKDGKVHNVDDIRLYFYQTSSSLTLSGYAEPANYKLEYQKEDGSWAPIENQVRTPNYSGANYNRIQFKAVPAKGIRATFTPQDGKAVGIKEIEAYETGIEPSGTSENQAPLVDAYVSANSSSGAKLVGTVKDDGLPADGTITTKWEQVSGPEGGKAKFANANSATTTAMFNKEGDYVLKLTASDGDKSASKELTVHGVPSDGTVNIAPESTATASYTNGYQPKDNAKKVIDGQVVYTNTPAETWNNWGDNTGQQPWLQLKWNSKVPLKKAKLFFWTDNGGVPMVSSWKLQYADANGDWKDVKLTSGQRYTVNQNTGNEVSFDTVETDRLRVLFPQGAIVGASEFEAYALDPLGVDDTYRLIKTGSKAADLKLPGTVSAYYGDGFRRDLSVSWPNVTDEQLAADGDITLNGTVTGAVTGAKATIQVRSDADSLSVNAVVAQEQTVYQNAKSFDLPSTVAIRYMNGAQDAGHAVEWDKAEVAKVDLKTVGDYTVTGTVADAGVNKAKLTIHVVEDPNGGSTPTPEPSDGNVAPDATVTASYTNTTLPSGNEAKVNDGQASANDPATESWNNWNDPFGNYGDATGPWVNLNWSDRMKLDKARVFFWSDGGGVPATKEWKLQYKADDGSWKDVQLADGQSYGVTAGQYNEVKFASPITTTDLRIVFPKDTVAGLSEFEAYGEKATEEPEPTPDTTAPTFAGVEDTTVEFGADFEPLAGVSAKDDVDGDVTKAIKVEGTVDTKKAGDYTLTYTVTDAAGNKAEATRKVTVKPQPEQPDTTKPVIKGADDVTVEFGADFDAKAGVTASDDKDGDLTAAIKVEGSVDTKKAGDYTLTYTVSDKAGNEASVKRTVTVKPQPEQPDTTKPVIKGADDVTVEYGAKFEPLAGVSASDDKDGDVTAAIKVEGSVDTSKAGEYTLTYTVADKAGNEASVKRTVTVKPESKPEPSKPLKFTDVTGKTPHADDIQWLGDNGISTGWKTGETDTEVTSVFSPMGPVVRQDMAAFLYRLAGSPVFDESKVANPFVDVTKSTPHYKEIMWLYSTGISTGFTDRDGVKTFKPMGDVVRQDMAAFLRRLADVKDAKPELGKGVTFTDVDGKTPHADDIAWLAQTGVTTGWANPDGKTAEFRGMNVVVRQDMAAFLHRMHDGVLK